MLITINSNDDDDEREKMACCVNTNNRDYILDQMQVQPSAAKEFPMRII